MATYGTEWDLEALRGRSGINPPEKRYWGSMERLIDAPGLKLKRIVMRAGTQSSLEFHLTKAEAYFVVSGQLRVGVRIGRARNTGITLGPGDSFFIPNGLLHMRIAETDVEMLEIATSDDPAESLIVEDGKTYRHVEE